jgi:formamidopyrimidine-DNA glycosylase
MPELPEVETVARQLDPHLAGRTLVELGVVDTERLSPGPPPERTLGTPIAQVRRLGKQVIVAFGPGGLDAPALAIHLRMSGRLIWRERAGEAPTHVRARLRLDRGEVLFVDPRRFGTITWHRRAREATPLGVDPLSRRLTPKRWEELLGSSRQELKAWLLRQDRLVGLGNIYACEILFEAGLSPQRPAGSLDSDERARLSTATRRVLRRAIRKCGTTFSDFQDAHGVTGSYQTMLFVYGREDEPCRRCGERIVRIVQQQRSTFHCPRCQNRESRIRELQRGDGAETRARKKRRPGMLTPAREP